MLTLIAWAFSVDIWDSEVVQFNPLETEYSTKRREFTLCFCVSMVAEASKKHLVWNRLPPISIR